MSTAQPGTPIIHFDALVLSGGRSSRLGGTPKASLLVQGRSLLQVACAAVSGAENIVVVGPDDGGLDSGLASRVRRTREDPPFGGPAAAVVAGMGSLPPSGARHILVLACDMPRIAQAVDELLAAARGNPSCSFVARDSGRDQLLAGLYLRTELAQAISQTDAASGARNLSMRALLATVNFRPVPVTPGATHDVDTWPDAQALGIDVE